MTTSIEPLIGDLVDWVAERPRPYREVIDAWRTSCPRLTVWEDAVERGLVETASAAGGEVLVSATAAGRAFVEGRRRSGAGGSQMDPLSPLEGRGASRATVDPLPAMDSNASEPVGTIARQPIRLATRSI